MKTCCRCGNTKELFLFGRDTRSKDGRASACCECINKANEKARREKGIKPKSPYVPFDEKGMRKCRGCSRKLHREGFGIRTNGRSEGRTSRCKKCLAKKEDDKRRASGIPRLQQVVKNEHGDMQCLTCKEFHPLSEYTEHRYRRCKACRSRKLSVRGRGGCEENYCVICQTVKDALEFKAYRGLIYPWCNDCQTNPFSYIVLPSLIPVEYVLRYRAAEYMIRPRSNLERMKRGHACTLTPEQIIPLIGSHCPASGVEYDFLGYMRYWGFPTPSPQELPVDLRRSPSLDRIDNDGIYEDGNVVVVCNGVNSSKNAYGIDMYEQIGRFYRTLIDGKISND